MITYENDNLIIPKKYKNMSAAQLEKEKEKTLKKYWNRRNRQLRSNLNKAV